MKIEALGPQYYRYTCEKCSKIFYSAAEDEICDCELITPVQKYYALREQAETLWAKRDALIEQFISLDWFDLPASKADIILKINELAQQAEALEVEARQIYNDLETWTSESASERLNQEIKSTWDSIPEIQF